MTISEKYQDVAGKWRVRVSFDDNSSFIFKFQENPTDDEVYIVAEEYLINSAVSSAQPDKNDKLKQAEDRYVLFCRLLGLPDKASSTDLDTYCIALKESGNALTAMEIAIRALGLINDVTQNGGKWEDIEYHGIVT